MAQDQDVLEELREDFSLLLEAGFIAVKQGDEVAALRIFTAAQLIQPNHTAPQIGLGYIAMNKLELKEASDIFQRVLTQEPKNYLAQTFLGMSKILMKNFDEGESIVRAALEKTDDSVVRNLGMEALQLRNLPALQDKTASPFFGKGSK